MSLAELNVSAAIAEAGGGNDAARVHVDRLLQDDVSKVLQQLKPKMSAGLTTFHGGEPSGLFRDCRPSLAKPLLHIYNECLETAVFPESWKIMRIVPVPKGGSETNLDG